MTLVSHSDRARSTGLPTKSLGKFKIQSTTTQRLVKLALVVSYENNKIFHGIPFRMRKCFDTGLGVGVSQEKKKQRRLAEQRMAGREVEWSGRPAVVKATSQNKNINCSL